MEPSHVDRVLEGASAQFEAAVAAEEDAAANDLALSLLQGSDLSVLLCRTPWTVRRSSGVRAAVTHVGPDVVRARSTEHGEPDLLLPLATALFMRAEGHPPGRTVDSFVSLLRQRVRSGGRIRVSLGEAIEGRAKIVTDTHVVLALENGEAVVPVSEIREVQLVD